MRSTISLVESSHEDPTENLLRLRARNKSREEHHDLTIFQLEMIKYEAMVDELPSNGDRLGWWKRNEKLFPLLSLAAKEILSIPCSSSKSERVFSTGGQVCFLDELDFRILSFCTGCDSQKS